MDKQIIPINNISIKHTKTKDKFNTVVEINDKFKIEYTEDYPFKYPTIYINENTYSSTLRNPNSPRLLKYMKRLDTPQCLCCATFLCNWLVTNTINTFLTEVNTFNNIRRKVKYHILMDELCKKYPKIPKYEILSFLL